MFYVYINLLKPILRLVVIIFQRGGMKPGQSILIHSGIGGVGQAAITYCLFYGLTVFTTVGNDQRKEMLKKLFPQIPGMKFQ